MFILKQNLGSKFVTFLIFLVLLLCYYLCTTFIILTFFPDYIIPAARLAFQPCLLEAGFYFVEAWKLSQYEKRNFNC